MRSWRRVAGGDGPWLDDIPHSMFLSWEALKVSSSVIRGGKGSKGEGPALHHMVGLDVPKYRGS